MNLLPQQGPSKKKLKLSTMQRVRMHTLTLQEVISGSNCRPQVTPNKKVVEEREIPILEGF